MEEQAEVGGSWRTSVTAAKEELIFVPVNAQQDHPSHYANMGRGKLPKVLPIGEELQSVADERGRISSLQG